MEMINVCFFFQAEPGEFKRAQESIKTISRSGYPFNGYAKTFLFLKNPRVLTR